MNFGVRISPAVKIPVTSAFPLTVSLLATPSVELTLAFKSPMTVSPAMLVLLLILVPLLLTVILPFNRFRSEALALMTLPFSPYFRLLSVTVNNVPYCKPELLTLNLSAKADKAPPITVLPPIVAPPLPLISKAPSLPLLLSEKLA